MPTNGNNHDPFAHIFKDSYAGNITTTSTATNTASSTALTPSCVNVVHPVRTRNGTLLPRPAASLISLFAQSTSLSLRAGTSLCTFALDSARTTTLTGLEFSRAVIESILIRAGKDVALRGSDFGRSEAETIVEKSLAVLHSTITSASFFASASFRVSSATVSSLSAVSQNLLSTLDSILGSTESSRAIAAIITLIRKEFRNPETVPPGESVGVRDLLVGSIAFALLQRWGRRATQRQNRLHGMEEVIWDVVILDNGIRADVVGMDMSEPAEYDSQNAPPDITDQISARPGVQRQPSFLSLVNTTEIDDEISAIRREHANLMSNPVPQRASTTSFEHLNPHTSLSADRQHELTDEEIRQYIMAQLPEGVQANIRTDTVSTRTVTVEIYDDDGEINTTDISLPPGSAVIAERFHDWQAPQITDGHTRNDKLPYHTVVFRTASRREQNTEMRRKSISQVENLDPQAPDVPANLAGQPAAATPDSGDSGSTSISDGPTKQNAAQHTSGPFSRVAHKFERMNTKAPLKKLTRMSTPSHAQSSFVPRNDNKENNPLSSRRRGDRPTSLPLGSSATKEAARANNKLKVSDYPYHERNNYQKFNIQPLSPMHIQRQQSPPRVSESSTSAPSTPASSNPNIPRRPTYYTLREKSSDFYVAHTDYTSRPSSPATTGGHHYRRSSAVSRSKSDKDLSIMVDPSSISDDISLEPTTPTRSANSKRPSSLYSLAAAGSETSLVLAPRPTKSVYEDQATISQLMRDGKIPGLFPNNYLVSNIKRFCRFSSASYGSTFMRMLGLSSESALKEYMANVACDIDPHEHNSFSYHTGLPTSTILLSSYVDPAGGSNAAGETVEGFPLVHFLALDHESKAVVLTLRGTWGFEDVLTDMTCDYDDLYWLGRNWQVHKGMHASARHLLEGGGGRVMATIKAALEEFPDYGVIFCGHSLGGGVAALLATIVSKPKEPGQPGPSFVTASYYPTRRSAKGSGAKTPAEFCLPPGRPIHVYAYGPPAVMSTGLRRATRGLVTTTVNGQDVVPTLSLGNLHDFLKISLAFRSDISDAKTHIKNRVWESITANLLNKMYPNHLPLPVFPAGDVYEDTWAWSTLQSLRDNMDATKLLPPGEVFVVETMRVLQRDAFSLDEMNHGPPGHALQPSNPIDHHHNPHIPSHSGDGYGYPRLGRPATRVQLKFVRDAETRFREIRFGSDMLGDHSPGRYEASLAALARGVLDD
ncbi:hypothetical protein KEM56_005994 [Ascosphaera pollenicola]|nr:hypothetical protein KEM56_005994 [Ascosphaera pollenicola]